MMNEINALVWPSPDGVGMMDPVFWGQTVRIAKGAGIIKADPSIDAYTTDIVEEALDRHHRRREGRGLHEGHRGGDPRRQLSRRSASAAQRPARTGRPFNVAARR